MPYSGDCGRTTTEARRRRPSPPPPIFNPIIVLRRGPAAPFQFFYDGGAAAGLRPLPAAISDFLMGSAAARLLEQLAQLHFSAPGDRGNPPAAKAAVAAMPTVEVNATHVDFHCAVCKEAFKPGISAKEMPCNHIYHKDCILPWLALRNSCPVCRRELPAEEAAPPEEVGLTIWRLPAGGFAVGRFSGRAPGETGLPVVFTEVDGGFAGGPGRRPGGGAGRRPRAGRGLGNAVRKILGLLGLRRNRRIV